MPCRARKLESITIRFPVQRAKIRAEKKEAFTACGEASTYQGTYSGVSFRATSEIPLISKEEKAQVLEQTVPDSPELWQDAHGSDAPLFW